MIRRACILSCLLVSAFVGLSAEASANDDTHETRDVLGWKLRVSKALLTDETQATAKAIALLEQQLAEIIRVVPAKAVDELKKVPLWFSPEYPGVPPRAEFHPDAGWLKDNGRDPAMARAVEFTNIRIFEEECVRMPNFALHELAHAYHFRVLGFDDRAIIDAYERAKAAGIYERVERHRGRGKPNGIVRAYALTDHKEYFAETTEAFFSRNDFFPFNRDELRSYDPRMFAVLEAAWGVAPP
jgi:dipeptidyl-peptidase-4